MLLYVLAGIVVLLTGTVHLALYTPIRNRIIASATESSLNGKVSVGRIRVRFLLSLPNLTVSIDDLALTYPSESDTVLGVRSIRAGVHVPSLFGGCIDVRDASISGVRAHLDWADTLILKPSEKEETEDTSSFRLPCMKVDFTLSDVSIDAMDYVRNGSVEFHLTASNSKEGVLDADIDGLCIKAAGVDLDATVGGRDILGDDPKLILSAEALADLAGLKGFMPEGIAAAGVIKLLADGTLAKKGADMLAELSSEKLRAATPQGRFALDDVRIVAGAKEGAAKLPKRVRHRNIEVPDFLQEEDFKASDLDVKLDSSLTSLLAQWNPRGEIHIGSADIRTPMLPLRNSIDGLDVKADLNGAIIEKLKIRSGASDLDIKGSLTGLRRVLTGKGKGVYKLDLDVHSKQIQANQLMGALERGKTAPAEDAGEVQLMDESNFEGEDSVSASDTTSHPLQLFVIPANVNADIHLNVGRAYYSDIEAKNLNARIRVAERTAQITDLLADTDAGSLRADAFYSTRTKTKINAGFALKLTNVSAAKVIDMVPAIDTLIPILSSFKGNLNCEVAATTRLDTLYNPVLPSMEGAFRITGSKLSLDEKGMFKTVARILLFKDRRKGRIDSLFISGTIHDNRVKIYPFILSLDRYSLVLGGQQSFNGQFDYKVSLVRSPILVKFGVNLKGKDFDHIKFRLMKAQYANLKVPNFHEDVDELLYDRRNAVRGAISKDSDNIISSGHSAMNSFEKARSEDIEAMDQIVEIPEDSDGIDNLTALPRLKAIIAQAVTDMLIMRLIPKG